MPLKEHAWARVREAWSRARQRWGDGYRPELHYMRGPGPRWREKHGQTDDAGPRSDDSPNGRESID